MPDDLLHFEFDDAERTMLRSGLIEWGGPARCTDELAVAMGFSSVAQMFVEHRRLLHAVESGLSLSRIDWLRVVLCTEIVFASSLLGGGGDWRYTTSLSDEVSILTLRKIQKKVTKDLRVLVRDGFGTRQSKTE